MAFQIIIKLCNLSKLLVDSKGNEKILLKMFYMNICNKFDILLSFFCQVSFAEAVKELFTCNGEEQETS